MFFDLAIHFLSLKFLQLNELSALEIWIRQEILNKQTHKQQGEDEKEDI